MLDHLNSQARQAVVGAERVAHGLAHHYVGTEHLLVGLAGVAGCAAGRALARCGLDADGVAARLEHLLGRGPHALAVAPPYTAAVELVLARSRWEARALGEDVATSGHLLLALLHHEGSTATTVLRDLGADPARLEDFVLADPSDAMSVDAEPTVPAPGGAATAGTAPEGPGAAQAGRAGQAGDADGGPSEPGEPGEPLAVRVVRLQRQVDRLEAEVADLAAIVRALAARADGAPGAADPGLPARR